MASEIKKYIKKHYFQRGTPPFAHSKIVWPKAWHTHIQEWSMLYSSSHLRGISRHYYKTHQRHHSECGLLSLTHRWLLAMNYLLDCLCKCCSLILSEHYWLPCTQRTRRDEREVKKNVAEGCEIQGQVRGQTFTRAFSLVNLTARRRHFNQSAWPVSDKGMNDDCCLGD